MPLSVEALACIQESQMIRVVLRSDHLDDDSVVTVPRTIFLYSDLAREKETPDCEEIVFSIEEEIHMQEFTYFVHFLYTGTIESSFTHLDEEELSNQLTAWINGFRVGHRLRADFFMAHCLSVAMKLHHQYPTGLDVTVGSEALYDLLPLLEQRPHEDMYEFLTICIAREWKDVVIDERQDRIAEWLHTFAHWPDFANDVKALCLQSIVGY